MKQSYTLRIPQELQVKIKEEAKRGAMSVNQYILYTLTKDIAYKEAAMALKKQIKNAPSREEAMNLLDAIVPDIAPMEKDVA